MKPIVTAIAIGWSFSGSAALAFVFDSSNCASCHASPSLNGAARPGAMGVVGEALLNLDASRNDGETRGSMPTFTAQPGETVELTMQVLNGRTRYAVAIDNLNADSVTGPANTNFLTGYGSDPTWFAQQPSSSPVFFTNVGTGLNWPATGQVSPRTYTFNLTVPQNAPVATYELQYQVAGYNPSSLPSKFVDSQYFYLQVVPPLSGDYNNNGMVDAADYVVWRMNLGNDVSIPNDETPGKVLQPDYDVWRAHFGYTSGSGSLLSPVPEPGSFVLLALSGLALRSRRPRRT